MAVNLREIAQHVQGELIDALHADVTVHNVRGLSEADGGSLSYVEDAEALGRVVTQAIALMVPLSVTECARPAIRVRHPKLAFAQALRLLHPRKICRAGIHATADVHETAVIDARASVGAYCTVGAGSHVDAEAVLHPHVHLGKGAHVGARSELRPHVYVEDGVRIGADVLVHGHTVLGWTSAPSNAAVVIGDGVEIGARTVIAAGADEPTRIDHGTRTDNHVYVGPGAHVGPGCLLVAHSHVGPNVRLEHHVTLAGQAMAMAGVTIGAVTIVGGRGRVEHDLGPRVVVSGDPAVPHKEELRRVGNSMKLAKLVERLERVVVALERA